jgi:hypothetical protein
MDVSGWYCHMFMNNGFWTGWLDLLAPLYNLSYSQSIMALSLVYPLHMSLGCAPSSYSVGLSTEPSVKLPNLCYDQRSVGQSVLEKSTHLGLKTRYLLLSDTCRLVDVGRSDERTDLSFSRVTVSSKKSVVSFTFYILLNVCLYNIYRASVSPGSLQQTTPSP